MQERVEPNSVNLGLGLVSLFQLSDTLKRAIPCDTLKIYENGYCIICSADGLSRTCVPGTPHFGQYVCCGLQVSTKGWKGAGSWGLDLALMRRLGLCGR